MILKLVDSLNYGNVLQKIVTCDDYDLCLSFGWLVGWLVGQLFAHVHVYLEIKSKATKRQRKKGKKRKEKKSQRYDDDDDDNSKSNGDDGNHNNDKPVEDMRMKPTTIYEIITFIDGQSKTVQIYCWPGQQQLFWLKWADWPECFITAI